ncbi:MAG: phosphoglycolate phosphatase [Pseudomonadota bacterium]
MQRFAGYLFDLDGTLVDTAPDIGAALNHALTRSGLTPVDHALTRHWVGHGARVLIEQALAHQNAMEGDVDRLLDRFIEHYESHIADHSTPYPDVEATLAELREAGARLAVVTNKRTTLTHALFDALGWHENFDVIVCGDTAARPKPAADPALHACAALALDPGEALFVGDSETDVACARAAGCPVVCVPDGYNHGVAPDALGADAVIRSISHLRSRS